MDISQEGGLWAVLSDVDSRKADFGQSFLMQTLVRKVDFGQYSQDGRL